LKKGVQILAVEFGTPKLGVFCAGPLLGVKTMHIYKFYVFL
jgi:hypothetical protein